MIPAHNTDLLSFYHNDVQKQKAEFYKNKLTEEKIWDKPIVTEITRFQKFYPQKIITRNTTKTIPTKLLCFMLLHQR